MPGSAAVRSDRAKADGMARSSAPTSASPASVTLRIKTPLGCRKEARWCARLLLLVNLDNVRPGKVRASNVMTPRRRGALGGARQGRRERRYAGISTRLRTPHRAAQRAPATQRFIALEALGSWAGSVTGAWHANRSQI